MLLYCVQDMTLTLHCQLLNRRGKITVIPNKMDRYKSFIINDGTFIDSCQFMLSFFDKLSSNLSKDQFRETRKYLESCFAQQPNQPQTSNVTEGGEDGLGMHVYEDYQQHPYKPPALTSDQQLQIGEDLALMIRKGVYSYQYIDSFERFQEPQLPPKVAFYSSLTEEDISDIDYTHAQRLFNHFNMTDFADYHNFSLLTKVLLLLDVFENFRGVFLQYYGLDLVCNYTSPGLFQKSALKMIDRELDLLSDIDQHQHLFIEEEIRRAVAMISHQYARVKAPGKENYEANRHNSYIMYLDANNFYGWVMSQPLLTSNFKWLTDKEMEDLVMNMIPDDSSRVYILECDLGKYYFYYLYIHVYFIKYNVFFLCISETPRDFTKCYVSSLCISEYPCELADRRKDT